MEAFVVGDDQDLAFQVQGILERAGQECPDNNLIPLADGSVAADHGELIVVLLSANPDQALQVLHEISQVAQPRGAHILAVGPPDAQLILRTIQEVKEYIDETKLADALAGSLAKIVGAGGDLGNLISILAPSGGSGSSMLAANLATALAVQQKTCGLIDMKLGAGVLDALINVRPSHSMADLCRMSNNQVDRSSFESSVTRAPSGVFLLTPPASLEDIHHVTKQGVRQILTVARSLYPTVVVDLDRTYGEEQVEVLYQSDVILIVLRLDFTSLRNTRQTLEHLEELGIDRQRIKLVINRLGQPKEVRLNQAEAALGMKIFHAIPEDVRSMNRSINHGVPVIMEVPKAPISRSLQDLAESLYSQSN